MLRWVVHLILDACTLQEYRFIIIFCNPMLLSKFATFINKVGFAAIKLSWPQPMLSLLAMKSAVCVATHTINIYLACTIKLISRTLHAIPKNKEIESNLSMHLQKQLTINPLTFGKIRPEDQDQHHHPNTSSCEPFLMFSEYALVNFSRLPLSSYRNFFKFLSRNDMHENRQLSLQPKD